MDVRKKETRRCVRGNEGKISRWKLDKQQDTKWSGKLELQAGRFEKHQSLLKAGSRRGESDQNFLNF